MIEDQRRQKELDYRFREPLHIAGAIWIPGDPQERGCPRPYEILLQTYLPVSSPLDYVGNYARAVLP